MIFDIVGSRDKKEKRGRRGICGSWIDRRDLIGLWVLETTWSLHVSWMRIVSSVCLMFGSGLRVWVWRRGLEDDGILCRLARRIAGWAFGVF